MTFKKDILEEAGKEEILGVVIGEMGWGDDYNSDKIDDYGKQPRDTLITWEEAAPFLDYEYSSGYGAPECNAIYAWTETKIIFVYQYDGATGVVSVPRNPQDCTPIMPGG